MIFEFGDYRLDERRVTLTGPKGPIHVEPQVFSVLQYLLNNRDRVIPKEELLDSVWGDRFVSESALSSRLKAARRAVGDDGRTQHTIRTVHGVGYHFVAAVDARSDAEVAVPAWPDRSLPALRNELVGRDEDLAGVLKTVRKARVTTITGAWRGGQDHCCPRRRSPHAPGGDNLRRLELGAHGRRRGADPGGRSRRRR